MRRFCQRLAVIASVSSAVLFSACLGLVRSDETPTPTPEPLDPYDVIERSLDAMSEAGGLVSTQVTSAEGEVSADVTLEVGWFSGEDGGVEYYKMLTDVTDQPTQQQLLIQEDLYVLQDDDWYVLSPWYQGTPPDEMPSLDDMDPVKNYEQLTDELRGVEQLEDEDIDGLRYLHLQGRARSQDYTADLWISPKSYRPRRLVLRSSGDDTTTFTITIDYTEYGNSLSLPPTPSAVKPWRDFDLAGAPCIGEAFAACSEAQAELIPDSHSSCQGDGPRVCFVPLGKVDTDMARGLVAYYFDTYGLEVQLLTPLAVPSELVDPVRQQVDGETAVAYIEAQFPADAADEDAILIGLTPIDIYDSSSHFRYLLGWKLQGRGVISSFRMDPLTYSEPADPEVKSSRTRKMLTKYIGLFYYGLPPSDDPASPMYDSIGGPDDLDAMSEPLDVPQAQ